jgi:hypothetical protein
VPTFAKTAKILTGKNWKYEVLERNAIFGKILFIGKITAKKESLFARFLAKILDFPETYRIFVLIFFLRITKCGIFVKIFYGSKKIMKATL